MKEKTVSRVLLIGLKSIFNPITLVSIFAPIIILQIGFLKLRSVLNSVDYATNKTYTDLKNLVTDNNWADTLIDINIQYVVLLVAFLFAIMQSGIGIFKIIKNHNLDDCFKKIAGNSIALIFLIFSSLMIILGIIVFAMGTLISPEQILLFRENSQHPLIVLASLHAPPLNSYIFICRSILSAYGVFLSFFVSNILPKILNVQGS